MQSKTEAVFLALRKRILDDEFAEGTVLSVRGLQEEYGVSHAPVRDALTWLQRDGYLEHDPVRGFTVAPWTEEDVKETYAIRTYLEVLAAKSAAERMTKDGLAELREIHEQSARSLEQTPPDVDAFTRAGRAFHTKVVELSGNRRLKALLPQISLMSSVRRAVRAFSSDDMCDAHRDHDRMIRAFEARDGEWAATEMYSHLRASEARHLESIRGKRGRLQCGGVRSRPRDALQGDVIFDEGTADPERSPLNRVKFAKV